MEHSTIILLISTLWIILSLSQIASSAPNSATPFVLLPNVLRLETDEVITLTTLGIDNDVTFSVYLQDYPARKKIFSERNVTVPTEEVANVTVRITMDHIEDIDQNPLLVFVVVQSLDLPERFLREVTILVNKSPGHIFIQTDKPIYTPYQTVLTRVIPLDDGFKPTSWPVQVEVKNPDGLTISRELMQGRELMRRGEMKIPENPVYGNWTVTAKFDNGLKTESTVRFEVKEYVLPIFAVTFDIADENKVILPNHTEFAVSIRARYVYGKPVRGHVTVTFGLLWHGHIFTVATRRSLQLNDKGVTSCMISMEELKLPVAKIWFPNGGKLHLKAAVTEQASGRIEKSNDISVVFSDHLHIIKFIQSSRYFKPGLSYVLEVEAHRADGAFGSNLPLNIECQAEISTKEIKDLFPKHSPKSQTHVTNSRGKLSLEFSISTKAKVLLFKVTPASESGEEAPPGSTYYFRVRPFYSRSNVYMQIQAELMQKSKQDSVKRVGHMLGVTTRYSTPEFISTINLVVISRGHIVWQARTFNLFGQSTSFYLNITQNMSPGMRILAFSVQSNSSEVISDSIWVDVVGQCDGKELTLERETGRNVMHPGDFGTISLKGPPHTLVGLLAVDSAVLLLKNSSLSRDKMFGAMRSRDRGCGAGGGKDTIHVFQNAGLSVITNAAMRIGPKLVNGCVDKMVKRKRRAINSSVKRNKKRVMDICCLRGARIENATVQFCYQLSTKLMKASSSRLCSQEFFHCCKEKVRGRLNIKARLQSMDDRVAPELEISFIDGDDDEDDDIAINMEDVPLRTNFPESWWFEEYNLGEAGHAEVDFILPDSITTWSIQAVGVSHEAGMCVTPPHTLTTFNSFFIHVDLPYNVVRLEQLEVRVTVYNYMARSLRVKLVLQSVDGICYAGEPGRSTDIIKLEVNPQDAGSTYFPIVPLEIGEFPIRVMAFSSWGRDAVEKMLRVEGEGVEKIYTVSVMLDPSGKRLVRTQSVNETFSLKNEVRVAEKRQNVELDLDLPHEVIPDTEDCTVHAMGDLLGPTIQVMIHGVSTLLRMPTGCGEQNLIYLAPNVYVTRYLRSAGKLSSTMEKKALTLIRQGVARQMTFRKKDGSFATWQHAESSSWLTAFAMKTLCQAQLYSPVDLNQTCQSFSWLSQKQKPDGSFMEDAWVTHREMLGGVNGDVSHTAFILIALLECQCEGQENHEVTTKTIRYVEHHAFKTNRPLAVAISAYALTLAGSRASDGLVSRLQAMAKSSPEAFTYWGPGAESDFENFKMPYWYAKKPGALAVEITSYALLTHLVRGDISTATNIVGWLIQQRNSHGAFVSTQDTVIGLQALSEYSIKSHSSVLDMMCHISSEVDDRFQKSISLTPEDAMVVKSIPKVPTGGKLHFEAEGTGVGVMQVDVRFNVPGDKEECMFEVKINIQHHRTMLQSFFGGKKSSKCEPCAMECEEEKEEEEDDYEDFTFPPIIPRILWSKRNIDNFTLDFEEDFEDYNKSRSTPTGNVLYSKIGRPRHRRSSVSYSAMVICIEACVRYKGDKTTGMSIVDVGLFTGFSPIEDDLKALHQAGKIDHYEKSKRSIVFYIDEVSNKDMTCLKFRARQDHIARNIQPAKVQVYDYYNPDDQCTVFYKIDNSSVNLVNFCDHQKQICQCLESRCSSCEESWHGLRWMDMMRYACNNATYVLEVKALDKVLENVGFERVLGQVVAVHSQRGKHILKQNDKIILLKRSSCFCPKLTTGKTYIFMTSDPRRFKDHDGNQVYSFLLDKKVFAVEYVKKMRGLSAVQKATVKNLRRTMRRLKRRGCARGVNLRDRSKSRRKRTRRGRTKRGRHQNKRKEKTS